MGGSYQILPNTVKFCPDLSPYGGRVVAQDQLRRRIRAAMALDGVSSWEDLADKTPFSRSLLKDLGTERARVEEKHLRSIAAACGVPYAWFTVPELAQALDGAEDATLGERVEALERRVEAQVTELRAAIVALSADSLQRTREQRGQDETDRPEERPGEGE